MEIIFVSLFPQQIEEFCQTSLIGKAVKKEIVRFEFVQIRDFANDRHRTVDDTPYGGGEGMVLRADVMFEAWKAANAGSSEKQPGTHTVLLSPQGAVLNHDWADRTVREVKRLILICGHYEGVDERFIERCVDEEVSIGDYVLTGGELPAAVLADVVVRRLPGVVGNPDSVKNDSLASGLLKYPQYTRPRNFEGIEIPEVLLSGNHPQIARWREQERQARTAKKRPDLGGES